MRHKQFVTGIAGFFLYAPNCRPGHFSIPIPALRAAGTGWLLSSRWFFFFAFRWRFEDALYFPDRMLYEIRYPAEESPTRHRRRAKRLCDSLGKRPERD